MLSSVARNLLLNPLPFGNILGNAEAAEETPVRVEFQIGLLANPFDCPIGDDAVFDVVRLSGEAGCPLAIHVLRDRRDERSPGMYRKSSAMPLGTPKMR